LQQLLQLVVIVLNLCFVLSSVAPEKTSPIKKNQTKTMQLGGQWSWWSRWCVRVCVSYRRSLWSRLESWLDVCAAKRELAFLKMGLSLSKWPSLFFFLYSCLPVSENSQETHMYVFWLSFFLPRAFIIYYFFQLLLCRKYGKGSLKEAGRLSFVLVAICLFAP